MQVLHRAGYTDIGLRQAAGRVDCILFDGVVGSLDHVLANRPAIGRPTGADAFPSTFLAAY